MSTLFDGNPIIAAVVTALRVLGAVSRTNADALLGLTTVQLTDRERTAVLDAFPPHAGEDDGHPAWCDREHADAWPVHTRLIGDVRLPGGNALEVALVRYVDGQPPLVAVTEVYADEDRRHDLPLTAAGEFRGLLDVALTLAGA
jgi:trimethylamine:corrinoid methyltransferase-like protein